MYIHFFCPCQANSPLGGTGWATSGGGIRGELLTSCLMRNISRICVVLLQLLNYVVSFR